MFHRLANTIDQFRFVLGFREPRGPWSYRPRVVREIFPSLRSHGMVECEAALSKSRPPLTSLTLRQCREALGLSQANFALQLGVPLETYRTWDSGRRPARSETLISANAQALRADPHALLPLETLALLIHVHVKTLHAEVRIVVSDVVIPRMHGPDLVQRFLDVQRDLCALFISGYAWGFRRCSRGTVA